MKQEIKMTKKSELTVKGVEDLFIRKCRVKNLSDQTIKTYQDKLKRFVEYLGEDSKIDVITADAVDDYTLILKDDDGMNDVTVATNLRHVRAFCYYAMECKYIENFKIHIPKTDKAIKATYTNEELERLLARPDINECTFTEFKVWAFENYLIATGNRLATALSVKIGEIDFDNGMIRMTKTKSRKQQIIPLSNSLAIVLQAYLEVRGGEPDDYLLPWVINLN